MPPQLTNITSEIEGDAPTLRLNLASTPSVPGFLTRYWRAYREWRWRRGPRITLWDLNDRELMDIGLTRGEIDYIMSERAIDRLRNSTSYLWGRGGM
jgi:uncharacterized protein YjiS (DUF1127 family)